MRLLGSPYRGVAAKMSWSRGNWPVGGVNEVTSTYCRLYGHVAANDNFRIADNSEAGRTQARFWLLIGSHAN
jgi:hypothetical protein